MNLPISFEAWKELHTKEELEEMEVVCSECDGSGEFECRCCGHVAECEECGGEGVLSTAKSMYLRAVERDQKRLKEWVKSTNGAKIRCKN